MSNPEAIRSSLQRSAEIMAQSASSPALLDQIVQASLALKKAYLAGGALFVAGNGGSAADAQHIVAELVVKLGKNRSPIRAFAMSVDTSILTACGNDFGFEYCFSRQVEGLMAKNDVFLGISTSGNSSNILNAFEKCRERGLTSILLSGATGGKARTLATHSILVPSNETRFIQESHLSIYHTLCERLEHDLIEAGACQWR
jgi:D-sedoheptulose 7-phosphate isomerase